MFVLLLLFTSEVLIWPKYSVTGIASVLNFFLVSPYTARSLPVPLSISLLTD